MSRIEINGIEVEYELIGNAGAPTVAITPGGRFSMTDPGIRELGEALAAGGKRALIWDRPNCGSSDICFDANSESELHADTLIALIRALDLGPTALAAGSAGSRVSLIAASRHPEMVSHLMIWWITGGNLSLMMLASYYCGESFILASQGGMEAVADAKGWEQQVRLNSRNRDIILAQTNGTFIDTMDRWATFYLAGDESPVPGLTAADFTRLTMPVLIFRNGLSDVSHPRKTSDWVGDLIPHAKITDAPWPDDEWKVRSIEHSKGAGLFGNWPVLAPMLLDFSNKSGR